MHGTFDPGALPALRDLRQGRLSQADWYAEPEFLPHLTMIADELPGGTWRSALSACGAVKVHLDRGLTVEEFIAVGQSLGSLIPERAPAVQPFVEEGVVLNLRTDLAATRDVDRQPFAENYITLHTEGSLSALDLQPRYLVFLCLTPPEPGSGGQTLVLPVRSLVGRLPDRVVQVLLGTALAGTAGVKVFRWEGDQMVLCFRDRGEAPIGWTASASDPDQVNEALGSLLLAMYDAADLAGIHWTAPSLVVLDNTAVMHGRSQIRRAAGQPRRHIQRLRVRAA